MFDVNYTRIVVNQYYFGSGYTKDDHAFNEFRLFGRGNKEIVSKKLLKLQLTLIRASAY